MLKKEMTRDLMLDALEHDYNGLMNLGDIYGARGVEAAIDTIHLYEKALELACEECQKTRTKKFSAPRPHRKSWKNISLTPRQRTTMRKANIETKEGTANQAAPSLISTPNRINSTSLLTQAS